MCECLDRSPKVCYRGSFLFDSDETEEESKEYNEDKQIFGIEDNMEFEFDVARGILNGVIRENGARAKAERTGNFGIRTKNEETI